MSRSSPTDKLLQAVTRLESRLREAEAYVKESQASIVKRADELSASMAASVEPMLGEAYKELEEAYNAEAAKISRDLEARLRSVEEELRAKAAANREQAVNAVIQEIKRMLGG